MFENPESYLVIFMFGTFILLLFTGFPVAWVLAGVGIMFSGIAYLTDQYWETTTGLDYNTLGLIVERPKPLKLLSSIFIPPKTIRLSLPFLVAGLLPYRYPTLSPVSIL